MSLCRYLPTPSDRMAVMWTLLNVGQAVVLEYGPAGTTHYSMGLFGNMGISPDQTLFTTHMSEDDVVMGDVTRLEDAIVELDRNYSPKVIFVIASAITAVIGTDLIGVCAYMQERVKARLIAMENGGFRGDYTVGLREAYAMLARELAGSGRESGGKTYNVLGASAGSYRIHHEFHFYFLHIMLLVYICLPVVRAFLRSASRREVEYALLVWFVTGILFPVLKDVWPFSLVSPISGWYLLPAAYSSIGYTMLGWYLRQYGGIARRWYLLSLACGAAFTFVSCSLLSLKYGVLAENLLSGWSPGPMLMSVGWFGLLLKVRVWPSRLRRGTGWLSRASFCIYLVHVCFLSLLRAVGITAGAGLTWLTIPGVTVLLLALSGLVYAVLCRTPVVKTYLI